MTAGFPFRRAASASTLLALAFLPASAWKSEDLGSIPLFPADNYWHWDISQLPIHPNSAAFVNSVGAATRLHPDFGSELDGVPWGIPYVVVDKNTPKIPVNYTLYGDESDPGPYPIPLNVLVEGGSDPNGDRHTLAVDKDARILYELYRAFPKASAWDAGCGAKWDLSSNAMRRDGWTSADAAGLPILPGLVRYDEIARGVIDHAIRMTVDVSQKAYVWPATHQAGSTTDKNVPPMGLRFRLKAGFDISKYPASCQTILKALKKYGFIVADNGGNWYFTGAPDERYPDEEIDLLKQLRGSDFEAVLSVDDQGKPIKPGTGVLRWGKVGRQGAQGAWHDMLGRVIGSRRDLAVLPLVRAAPRL
jgi:hypothetical protein